VEILVRNPSSKRSDNSKVFVCHQHLQGYVLSKQHNPGKHFGSPEKLVFFLLDWLIRASVQNMCQGTRAHFDQTLSQLPLHAGIPQSLPPSSPPLER
jgi:hypothetical protein